MGLARSVAALAGKARAPMHQAQGGVRIVFERLSLGCMAESTGLIAGKAGMGVCRWDSGLRRLSLRYNHRAAQA